MKTKKTQILFYIIAILVVFFAGTVNLAFAELPSGDPISLVEVEGIIERIAQFLIVVGVIIAVIFIILAGVKYMVAGSDEAGIKKAREMLKSGIIGAAIVLGVGVIIQTVASIVTRNFFGGWFY